MKVAILYICTGAYNRFFNGFYESSMKYFLAGKAEKEYFVFTDDMSLSCDVNVHLIRRQCQGFPADSLFRFDMFLQVKEQLAAFDYVYFFNANAEFRKSVNEEILPDETGLAMGLWYNMEKPWWNLWHIFDLPAFYSYERNRKSLAYIPPYGKNYKHYMGGLNGGRVKEYMQMVETLSQNIRTDYNNGIIAVAHDQSHINAYMRKHQCKDLPREMCWPEEWPASFEPKIVFRDKMKMGEPFVKGRRSSAWGRFKRVIKRIKRALSWYV